MFIGRANQKAILNSSKLVARRDGFTLLEIMLAVAILAMMSLAIYRFVQSNLAALRASSDASATVSMLTSHHSAYGTSPRTPGCAKRHLQTGTCACDGW